MNDVDRNRELVDQLVALATQFLLATTSSAECSTLGVLSTARRKAVVPCAAVYSLELADGSARRQCCFRKRNETADEVAVLPCKAAVDLGSVDGGGRRR
jgi:hypothetical protein